MIAMSKELGQGGSYMNQNRVMDGIGQLSSMLGPEAVFVGDILGADNYLIHGRVVGNSDIQGVLMLGEACRWTGNIVADVVILKGIVKGNITARHKLEIRPTGRVLGEVDSPIIAVARGAALLRPLPEGALVTHFEEQRA
jgi:cytoskeletal protein CcmA (bactofilin family)